MGEESGGDELYLIVRQIDELQLFLISKGVIGQGDQLVVAQVQLEQLGEALEHQGTDLPQVVVGDVEILQLLRHLQ